MMPTASHLACTSERPVRRREGRWQMRQLRHGQADYRVWEGADANGASLLPAAAPLSNAAESECAYVREQPRPSPYRIFNFDVGPLV
jgi:hypothetical protein